MTTSRSLVDELPILIHFARHAAERRDEKIDWLQLCRSGGVGPQTFFKLLRRFGSARRALEELPRLAREAGGDERWRLPA